MTLTRALPAFLLAALPVAGVAQDNAGVTTYSLNNGPLTYEVFEAAVPHSDLSSCPAGYSNDDHFCRITVAQDATNIFVFRFEGDMPLLHVLSYPLDGGFPQLQ